MKFKMWSRHRINEVENNKDGSWQITKQIWLGRWLISNLSILILEHVNVDAISCISLKRENIRWDHLETWADENHVSVLIFVGEITTMNYKERLKEHLFNWNEGEMGQMRVFWDLRAAEPSSTSGVAQTIPKYFHVSFPCHLKYPSHWLDCDICQHYFKYYVVVEGYGMEIKWLRNKNPHL